MAADIEFCHPGGLHERGFVRAHLGLDDLEQSNARLVRKRRQNREEGRRLGTTAIDEDETCGFGSEELLQRGKERRYSLVRCVGRGAIEAVPAIARGRHKSAIVLQLCQVGARCGLAQLDYVRNLADGDSVFVRRNHHVPQNVDSLLVGQLFAHLPERLRHWVVLV